MCSTSDGAMSASRLLCSVDKNNNGHTVTLRYLGQRQHQQPHSQGVLTVLESGRSSQTLWCTRQQIKETQKSTVSSLSVGAKLLKQPHTTWLCTTFPQYRRSSSSM